ncbi:hypothetical protein Y032_0522g2880 [Ancylostoma ceylanicum]|uniref:Uncharacterized protein n=1 Tax=Ancylostoma ceylanicum TaxID=53326 RepID=A0A016WTR6_9BILA|nr:hypothetical protein Y032_0522g2880 [Ancylostoma ceylanicum]
MSEQNRVRWSYLAVCFAHPETGSSKACDLCDHDLPSTRLLKEDRAQRTTLLERPSGCSKWFLLLCFFEKKCYGTHQCAKPHFQSWKLQNVD